MSKDQSMKLNMVSDEIRKLQGSNSLNYKDSLSRLSEAIDLFKSNRHEKVASGIDTSMISVEALHKNESEIQLQTTDVNLHGNQEPTQDHHGPL